MITNKQIAQRVRERCGDKIVVVLVPMKRIEFDETYTTWIQSFVVKQNLIQRVNKDYHIMAPLSASLRQVIGTFLPHNIHYYSENNNKLHIPILTGILFLCNPDTRSSGVTGADYSFVNNQA